MVDRFFLARMREVKNSFNHIRNIRARASTVLKELEKKNELNDGIKFEILSAKSIDVIEHLVCSWSIQYYKTYSVFNQCSTLNYKIFKSWYNSIFSMHRSKLQVKRHWLNGQSHWALEM